MGSCRQIQTNNVDDLKCEMYVPVFFLLEIG